MKYKLEMWKYDIFAYEEAQDHLNERAQSGLELVAIEENWMPLALYEKSETAKEKRYAVEMIEKGDEKQFQLYRDSGWEKVQHLRNSQCIFEATDCNVKPLFTDPVSKYQNAVQVIHDSSTFVLSIVMFIAVAAFLIFAIREHMFSGISATWKTVFYSMIGILSLQAVGYLGNFFFIKRAADQAAQGILIRRPEILKWSEMLSYCGSVILCLLFFAIFATRYIWISPSILGVVFTMLAPILFFTGFLLKAFLRKKGLGFFFMFCGAWAFYGLLMQVMG